VKGLHAVIKGMSTHARTEILLALGLRFSRGPPMIAMIKRTQRDSTSFRCGIICSRLFRQYGLCQGFTGVVAQTHYVRTLHALV
jgi:hypothetical protein